MVTRLTRGAGPFPLGAGHRSAGLSARAALGWGTSPPARRPGPGRAEGLPPTPNRLAGCPDLPGRTEGARRGAGSDCKPRGVLAGVRADAGTTSAAHVPSGTGRPDWELQSAGRTKTGTHSLGPPRGGRSPGGKLQWSLGRGLGARGPAWGAGGRGESGAFFVCKVSLNNGCSALSSLLLLLLGSPRRRLSLPLPPSSPPALPRPPGPSAGGTRRGRTRHSHSLTLAHSDTHTQRPPAACLSPFLSLPPSLPTRSLRASLRMRPQGGRRVELPPPAPPPP